MTVHPVEDCTFWYTTESLKASGTFNWSTRNRQLQIPQVSVTRTKGNSQLTVNAPFLFATEANRRTGDPLPPGASWLRLP
jgi:hypothetical protein